MKLLLFILLLVCSTSVFGKKWAGFSDYQCMVANLYFEARGESYEGMKAVAIITLNRVKSKRYPPTVCEVVFQRKQFSWTHQKQWSVIQRIIKGDVRHLRKGDLMAYNMAKFVAKGTIHGTIKDHRFKDSMYYHATYVNPKWARKMQKVARVGTHVFYRG